MTRLGVQDGEPLVVVRPLITVSFGVSTLERMDPSEITNRIGLSPTSTCRAGDEHVTPTGYAAPPRKRTMWRVDVGPRRTFDFETMLEEMLDLLEPAARRIQTCVTSLNLEYGYVSVVVYMADDTPATVVSVDHMRRLVAVNLGLDLDLYVVDEAFLDNRLPAQADE